MHQILVATDFSAAARNAFEYALHLGELINANIHLTYIHKASNTPSEQQGLGPKANENQELLRKLQRWAGQYPDQKRVLRTPAKLQYDVFEGKVASGIEKAAKTIKADVIILGGREKHNIREHLFGSVTTQLTGRTPCPMLIIPEKAKFQPLQAIAFAIDITLNEKKVLRRLKEAAQPLDVTIQPFFVNMLPDEQDKIKLEHLDANGQRIDMVRDREVTSGITYYLEKYPVQMLAMYIPKRAFHEHLLHGHLLRYMVWHTPLPLLLVRA